MPEALPPPQYVSDVTLAETLDRVLDTGAVLRGDVVISVADVELLYLDLRLLLSAVDTARGYGAMRSSATPDPASHE
ncbi:MAG: gas vesicle protein [Longimonas sp.]|uniref:gas vesicle protein n=1 Tax=Longimonas sp. TaxID=2039626 RepID=UPI003356B0A5